MSEWRECKLADVGRIVTGKTPSTKIADYWNEGVQFVTPADLQRGKFLHRTDRTISEKGRLSVGNAAIPQGSICVSCIGNLGYTSVATQECLTNQQINSIVVGADVDRDYVYYWLKYLWPWFKHSEGQSTTISILNKKEFSDIKISLPSLPTQRKIAAVVGALDDKIELNRKMNANLEAMAQALFKSWFVDFEPFGGQMPEGWKETPLVDLADFVGGYSYTSSELQASDCAMATIKNFDRNGGFKLDGYKEIVPSPKLKDSQRVDLFDILVAHTDLTQNAEVIGNAEMVLSRSGYKSLIMSTDLVKVLPKSGVSRFVLAGVLKYAGFKGHALGYVNGTTVLHMSKKALPEYVLPYPEDPSVLAPLAASAEAIYRKIALNHESSRTLAQLRDTLLPKLMSGELNVDDVKID